MTGSVDGREEERRDCNQILADDGGIPLLLKSQDGGGERVIKSSTASAVFNLSTNIVGAGIMALPACAKVLGVIPTFALIIFIAFLTDAAIELLLRFSRAGNTRSYAGVMEDAFGTSGRIVLQVAVIVKAIGVLIIYVIIVGDVLSGTSSNGVHHQGILEERLGVHWWTGRFFVLLITTLVVFLPLACFRRIDSLKYTSAISVALAVVFVIITVGISIVKLMQGSVSIVRLFPEIKDLASFWKLFTVVPVIVTAFICHYNVHTVSNELANSSQMKRAVQTSLSLCSTIYITTSFFGFLLFGDDTLDDVLANFDLDLNIPFSLVINDIVRLSYAVHLMFVFPVVFFALRLNVDGLIFSSADPFLSNNRRFILITLILVSLIFVGANFIPNIWVAFQLTGATAAACVGFIFPAAISLKDPHGIATRRDKILSAVMIILAICANAVALSSDLYSIFQKN
ncbi:amino acid transporter AVT6A-like [Wolffia australiana]